MNTNDTIAGSGAEDKLIKEYLLGELPAEEQDRLEDRLFAEDRYGLLWAAEEDLIEAYARNELGALDRARFESHFLSSPRRRARVEFTKTLLKAIPETRSIEIEQPIPRRADSTPRWLTLIAALRFTSPSVRVSLATLGAIVIIGAAWLIAGNLRLRAQLDQLQAESAQTKRHDQEQQQQLDGQRKQNEHLTAELRRAQPPKSPSRIFALALTLNDSPGRGSGERKSIVIPRGPHRLRLQLEFKPEEKYRGFRASLQTAEGKPAPLGRAQLTAPGIVELTISTNRLKTNDYILTLQGVNAANMVEDLADYQFKLVKK